MVLLPMAFNRRWYFVTLCMGQTNKSVNFSRSVQNLWSSHHYSWKKKQQQLNTIIKCICTVWLCISLENEFCQWQWLILQQTWTKVKLLVKCQAFGWWKMISWFYGNVIKHETYSSVCIFYILFSSYFPKVLTRRGLFYKSRASLALSWWSFALFSWSWCLIQGCKVRRNLMLVTLREQDVIDLFQTFGKIRSFCWIRIFNVLNRLFSSIMLSQKKRKLLMYE